MKSKRRTQTAPSKIKEYLYIIVGSAIVALAFNLFLNPNRIATGGVSGISIIVEDRINIEAAITQWALNIPLFVMGILFLGKKFGVKTAVGSVVLPLFVFLTRDVEPLTTEPLLAALYGGVGVGLGLGTVFRGKGSTGGTDLAAQIIHKYTGLTLGLAVLVIDGLVVLSAGIVFGPEKALYALIGLYVTSKTIDLVQVGLGYSKVALIISEKQEKIKQTLLHDLDRGVTHLSGYGGYTGDERPVLMCVVNQTELTKLKDLVSLADPDAFVIVTSANEVLGEGFKKYT